MYINVQSAGTAEEFKQKSRKGYWVILYYANWCPHCQMMKPEWKRFADKHDKDQRVNVAEVESQYLDQVGEEHKGRVQGYPTVMCAKDGKALSNHDGPRTADSFNDFANSNIVKEEKPSSKMFNLSGNNVKEINLNTILKADKKKKKSKKSKKSKRSASKSKGKKKTVKKSVSKKRKSKSKKD